MSSTDTAAQNGGAGNEQAIKVERERVRQVREIGRAHKIDASKVDRWVDDGLTVDQVNAAVLGEVLSRTSAPTPRVTTHQRSEDDSKKGFRHHRDFFLAAIENAGARSQDDVRDERLRPLAVVDKEDKTAPAGELAYMMPVGFDPRAAVGSDEQGTYSDPYGGFAVTKTRLPGMLQVGFEGDPTAGRTRDMPMGSPTVEILARTDKDHSSSVSGGFTVSRKAETAAAAASRMATELVTLKASSLFGLAYATEELLTDSPISFAALIDAGFRDQFGAHLLNEKLVGTGVGEYKGIIGDGATISIAKEAGQAAETVVAKNVQKMASRCWGLDNAAWFANHGLRPQLYELAIVIGTAGFPIYQPAKDVGFPDMLLGRPIFYSEYCKAAGTVGDIILANWREYLEGTYQPLQGAESIHVRFLNHERAFKLWTRNAGGPWWRSVLTPANGPTMSPFITLATRA